MASRKLRDGLRWGYRKIQRTTTVKSIYFKPGKAGSYTQVELTSLLTDARTNLFSSGAYFSKSPKSDWGPFRMAAGAQNLRQGILAKE